MTNKKIKVLFDLTYIVPGNYAGVAIYAYRLIHGFLKYASRKMSLVVLATPENLCQIKSELPNVELIVFKRRTLNKLYFINDILNRPKLNRILKKNKIDVFFSPWAAPGKLNTDLIPSIGVVHDLQPYEQKKGWKRKNFMFQNERYLVHFSKIVTISEFSKKTIEAKIERLKKSIDVVYNSVPSLPFNDRTIVDVTQKPYILFVSTLEPYKNVVTLIRAFNLIKKEIRHNLYIKAQNHIYWKQVVEPFLIKEDLTSRVFILNQNMSDLEMGSLYKNASILISPSLMEGFGYTPIEAAILEVPVICCKEGALWETTEGLLNYYEPATDEYALSKKILEVIDKPVKNLRIIAEKLKTAYSVEKQVLSFCKIIHKIL